MTPNVPAIVYTNSTVMGSSLSVAQLTSFTVTTAQRNYLLDYEDISSKGRDQLHRNTYSYLDSYGKVTNKS